MKTNSDHNTSSVTRAPDKSVNTPFFSPAKEKSENGATTDVPDLQRNPFAGVANWWGDVTNSRPDEARLDAQEDLADFRKKTFQVKNHHPSTGKGLFDAVYQPDKGVLDINVKINFDFQNGSPFEKSFTDAHGHGAFLKFNPLRFMWTKGEKISWKRNAINSVRRAWQDQYKFSTTKLYWESLPAVHVHINVLDSTPKEAHFKIAIQKWPDDTGMRDGIIPPGASDKQSTGEFEETDENGITQLDESNYRETPNTQNEYGLAQSLNPQSIPFEQGSDEISLLGKVKLMLFASGLAQSHMPPFPLTLTGRTSSEGKEGDNEVLAERRASAVSNVLVSGGVKRQPKVVSMGEKGATKDPKWRRVDIRVNDYTSKQQSVLHEFGHIFGLGDEYPGAKGGTVRKPGTKTAHSDLTRKLMPGQKAVVIGDNDNIMSAGEVVQPHHYITFLEVLGKMTSTAGEWKVGAGPGGRAHEPGDFPLPRKGGTTIA